MAVILEDDIADTVSHLPGVRRDIVRRTRSAAGVAKAKLAARRSSEAGQHSSIDWEVGATDGYVSLVDPDGGAMSIEYGRTGLMGKGGPSQGVFALQGIW